MCTALIRKRIMIWKRDRMRPYNMPGSSLNSVKIKSSDPDVVFSALKKWEEEYLTFDIYFSILYDRLSVAVMEIV